MMPQTSELKNLERTIVYIEDNPTVKDVVVYGLKRFLGVNVVCVSTLEGFYQWHEQGKVADLYISDGSFPRHPESCEEKCWEEVVRNVEKLSETHPTKGVVITTGAPENPEAYQRHPIIRKVIAKPFGIMDLCSAIKDILAE
jgi:hypothetical protein